MGWVGEGILFFGMVDGGWFCLCCKSYSFWIGVKWDLDFGKLWIFYIKVVGGIVWLRFKFECMGYGS